MWLILELNNFISCCNVQNAILSVRIVLLVKKRKRSSNQDVDNPRTKVFRRRTITVSILFAIIPFIFLICITSFFSLYLYQSRAYACRYLRTHVGCPKEGICTFIIDFIKSLNEEKNHTIIWWMNFTYQITFICPSWARCTTNPTLKILCTIIHSYRFLNIDLLY